MNHSTIVNTVTRGIRLSVVAALVAVLANISAPSPVAQAATITVNTANDELDGGTGNGVCSLREAISNANNNDNAQADCAAGIAALDTITFDAVTDGTPIVLGGAAGEDANASGDLDILDGGDLTIQGNGAANTIIDGNGTDRVLHVCPGGGCANSVTVYGVTIRNGSADFGGGILNLGATLNVQDSTIGGAGAGNTAIDECGGIDNRDGTTTLDGTIVSANRAQLGGGICNHATLNVQNGSTIGGAGASNRADNGGGIYNNAGTTSVNASTVISNTADIDGGGIYNNAGTTTVNASTVISNTAADDGGGIHNEYGTTTVYGSTVSANIADDYGGGIYNHATLNVQNSIIGGAGASNRANYGGGIHNFDGQTTVDSSTISGNKAKHGGGIYNHFAATLNIQNGSTIGGAGAGNTATSNGGGIYNGSGGTTTVDASTVISNAAVNGGGIYNDATPPTNNGSTVVGILASATLNVQNGSTIGGTGVGNTATVSGGGIFNGTDGTTTVDASTVISNTAGSAGGGIFNWFGTTTVYGSTVISNTTVSSGGGIYNNYGTTTVDSSTVSANTAHFGGGIYNSATLNVTNSTIGRAGAGNTATAGGGIHNEYGTTTVYGSTISANTAQLGGGIHNDCSYCGTKAFDGSTVISNTASPGGILASATLNVTNSTIGGAGAGNTATTGGGIYNGYEATMQVMGSRILHNTASNGGGVFNWTEDIGATSVTGSCIVGNSDTSFFNDKAAQQTATGNWWGAATGPNTPGADTVSGNVDTNGFLKTPILGCYFYIYLPLMLK